jgi:hypothetical protein
LPADAKLQRYESGCRYQLPTGKYCANQQEGRLIDAKKSQFETRLAP